MSAEHRYDFPMDDISFRPDEWEIVQYGYGTTGLVTVEWNNVTGEVRTSAPYVPKSTTHLGKHEKPVP